MGYFTRKKQTANFSKTENLSKIDFHTKECGLL
ncbi:hypothetical protein BB2000_1370 [Proteus mirabilis BB2000]|nr:hypothetical protein BB2000_1370 [Proteus mirabilis BB2000]